MAKNNKGKTKTVLVSGSLVIDFEIDEKIEVPLDVADAGTDAIRAWVETQIRISATLGGERQNQQNAKIVNMSIRAKSKNHKG